MKLEGGWRDDDRWYVDGITHLTALTARINQAYRATSLCLVEDAVRMVRQHGSEPATVAEVRQALARG
ncbi:hypothetical protein ACU4GH_27865 [Bradyrhizobium betae]